MIKKNLDTLDLFKFIASIFVVGIHLLTHPTLPYQNKYLNFVVFQIFGRAAVPFFFIASAYLFYVRYLPDPKLERVKRFSFRIIKLYIFWFIVLLPITIEQHIIKGDGSIIFKLVILIKNLFVSETFGASWYLASSLFSIIVVSYLLKFYSPKKLIILTTPIFIFCVLTSTYGLQFMSYDDLNMMKLYIFQPSTSIVCGLFYVSIGAYIAQNSEQLQVKSNTMLLALLCVIVILGNIEVLSAMKLKTVYTTDQYFILPFIAILIFILSIKINISLGNMAYHLRNCSTVVYLSHLGISFINNYIYVHIAHKSLNMYINFCITLLLAILLYIVIYRGKKYLKYAY